MLVLPFVTALALAACATAPKEAQRRAALQEEAGAALTTMQAKDPSLGDFLTRAQGYVVFPSIAKGGVLVGGAFGRGVVYENGRVIGYAKMEQASLGAQLGGRTFSELIVFGTASAFDRFKAGRFGLGAELSAVFLNRGAASSAEFIEGIAVFVLTKGGLMFDVSVNGQRLRFQRAG